MEFATPHIFCSRCITFEHCRWNGLIIASEVVELMKPHVEFVTACPERDIGLGVPRKPIRLVKRNDEVRLLQSETEADVTDRMKKFSRTHLEGLGEIDGFILKGRSPSCGMNNVKMYPGLGKVQALTEKTAGLFAAEVLKRFPHLPVEDEGRLTNFTLREHFFIRIFALARLRQLLAQLTMHGLVEFHAQHKLILMAYNQTKLRELGHIVANHKKLPVEEVARQYTQHFTATFSRLPRRPNNVNVLMHAFGYFSKRLTKDERAFFLEQLDKYRAEKLPLSVPIIIIKSYIARFGEEYLAGQAYFSPFPEELMELKDSGEGRKL